MIEQRTSVEEADPYVLFGLLGKRVIHPGGRRATEELLTEADLARGHEVLDIGCGFDTVEDWLDRYGHAGLRDLSVTTGPFEMMTPVGFLSDEGLANSVRVMARALAHPIARQRMAWLMPRISRAVPYLGYVLIRGRKPS